MMKQNRRAALYWGLSLLWMAVIFVMSAMPGDVSGEQSGGIAQIVGAVLSLLPQGIRPTQDMLNLFVRKAAHMAEYAVLLWLLRRAMRESGVRRCGLAAFVLAVLYAATDEFHQSFVPGRGPAAADVLIDAAGAAIMWAAVSLHAAINKKRK